MAKVFAILAENPDGGVPAVVGVADPVGMPALRQTWDKLREESVGCSTTVRAWLLSDTQTPMTASIDPALLKKRGRAKSTD